MGMTKGSKPVPKTAAQLRKWRTGVRYICVHSKSPGYKEGEVYECYEAPSGVKMFMGRDGFCDPCEMLLSGFVEEGERHVKAVN